MYQLCLQKYRYLDHQLDIPNIFSIHNFIQKKKIYSQIFCEILFTCLITYLYGDIIGGNNSSSKIDNVNLF
jgi:hypothetical protein